MSKKRMIAILLALALIIPILSACGSENNGADSENSQEQTDSFADSGYDDTTASSEAEKEKNEAPDQTPVDIETIGGAVIVGTIGKDENGWYIRPDQPLNITYTYFLDNPSVFQNQKRISMFDPEDDGIEKALYIGQGVTVSGKFSFYRDDFETLYFLPYTITVGKNTEKSYAAPDLSYPEEPKNLYDPSVPLPEEMIPVVKDGHYEYNVYMLSEETLEFMGNDFADFYVSFVDAFMNYKTELSCSNKSYAEMLSTVINYEFPFYNACAEPFEFFKHYDSEKGVITIDYKYDEAKHLSIINQMIGEANEMLANTSADKSDYENAKSIYHLLCTRMTYDYSALEDFERKENYYAYLYNSGVCVTFADVYNQLLTRVGIKTSLAHCDSVDTIGHTWSVATIDKKAYFFDPTYELSYDSGEGYRYFGLSYEDRTADGTGAKGMRYGRYYLTYLDPAMIAKESLNK